MDLKRELYQYIAKNKEYYFRGNVLIMDDTELRKSDFGEVIGYDLIKEAGLSDEFNQQCRRDKERNTVFNTVFTKLKNFHQKQKLKKIKMDDVLPESNLRYDYIPLVCIEKGATVLMNPETKEISRVNNKIWSEYLDKELREAAKRRTRMCKFVYDPYNLETLDLIPFEDSEILKYNTYLPPQWRLMENPGKVKCPEEIDKVLNHLFPRKEAKEYILDWLFHALTNRNEVYLVLNGAKGIGKGVFCSIVRMLVGSDHYSEAPDSLLSSQFNSVLDEKRVIILDEFKVNKAMHTRLKRYINRFQNIEKKGVDADRAIEIFNSYIISNNDLTDMYIEYDDRRFSVPDMTEKDLTEIMTKNEIKELVKRIEDEDGELAFNFGYYIFNRGAVSYDNFGIFKGQTYFRLVQSSLKVWQKFILREVLKGDEEYLSINNLRRSSRNEDKRSMFPHETDKIRDFLKNYKYREQTLGEVVDYYEDECIKVNSDFLKKQEIDDDDEDLL